jgi:phytoene synthase
MTLDPARRLAMCAIYAFMRISDDVSDEAGDDREQRMAAWSAELTDALSGNFSERPLWPAFYHTVTTYSIPHKYFYDLLEGTGMDLVRTRYETWNDLSRYCYHVASVVGFVCIYVWGFDTSDANVLKYAESCGLALQLTNILRDVREDIERDRVYLPQEDLRRFGVTEEMLTAGIRNSNFTALMTFETDRAEELYRQAWKLVPLISAGGRPTLRIMIRIYYGILVAIKKNQFDVFRKRARVGTPVKLGIVAGEWIRARFGILGR